LDTNCFVRRGGEFDYEVSHMSLTGDTFSINLLRRECFYRKWLITGLPCCHAIACMKDQDINIDDYILYNYLKEKYEACYRLMTYPANGQKL